MQTSTLTITDALPRWRNVSCHGCGGERLAARHVEPARYFDRRLTFRIVRCADCGLVFTNPRLADENQTYSADTNAHQDLWQRHDRAKRPVLSAALDTMARCAGQPRRRLRGKLLDVGCGAGAFLELAARRGLDVTGLEPTAVYAAQARRRGFPVVAQKMETTEPPGTAFDFITAWDVIEHVDDPRRFLERCVGWLRPGGMLALRMPSARWQHLKAVLCHRLLRSERFAYAPIIHLTFFSPETLAELAAKAGLSVIHTRTTPFEANAGSVVGNVAKKLTGVVTNLVQACGAPPLGNLEIYLRKE